MYFVAIKMGRTLPPALLQLPNFRS